MASKIQSGRVRPIESGTINRDADFPSVGEFISIPTDVNAPEFGPMRSAPPTATNITGLVFSVSSSSVHGGSTVPGTPRAEGESKNFMPHVCLVLAVETTARAPFRNTWRVQVCATRSYGSKRQLESYLTKYPDWHIPLPYDGGNPNGYPSPAQFGESLDVGYVRRKATAFIAVKRWVNMGSNGTVCTT